MDGSQHNSEKEEGELSSDDDYQSKLSEMQTYIPFLQQMIQRLEQSNDRSREAQLSKMKSLYGILSNTKKKLKVETLKRCEDVLRNLMNKVEKSTNNKEGSKVKKKGHKDVSSHTMKSTVISDSNSSTNEQVLSQLGHDDEKDDSRVGEKISDHDAVVSSTTQSCDSENPVTDVVKALKLAAARNNLRNKLENVKTAMHSPGHSDDIKGNGNVSSSSPSHIVSSSSSTKQSLPEKSDCHTKEGLEQSRERLKKLMGHHLTATPSPPYHSPSEARSRSFERTSTDAISPQPEWVYNKDSSWDQYSGGHSVGSDSCDGELFTRRDGWHREKDRSVVQSTNYNYHDDSSSKNERSYEKSVKSEVHKTSLRPMKTHVTSSPRSHSKIFSPERGDESDKSDSGSGSRSIRAKLEQEIHKVHRVGTSSGGALRSLANKEDRNRSSSQGKSDEEKSPRNIRPAERFERSSLDGERHCRERYSKHDEKPVDPRRRRSNDRSPSPGKSSYKGDADSIRSKRKSPVKTEKGDTIGGDGGSKEVAKTSGTILSSLSQEELQRIVAENLRHLPSPPPNTKEILETVKMSPGPNPSWKSFPQSSIPPSTPPEEIFHPTIYPQHPQPDVYYVVPQQPYGNGRQGSMEDSMYKIENHISVDPRLSLGHSAIENTVHNAYGPQNEERQTVLHHDYDPRTSFSNVQSMDGMHLTGPQPLEDPRSASRNQRLQLEASRDRNNANPRYIPSLLETPPQSQQHHNMPLEDPRLSKSHSYRDDSRREHMRRNDDSRGGGERRRGLLPTPPKYEKVNYINSSSNSRAHVQDISSRFDQRPHLNEKQGSSHLQSDRQNWEVPHWVNPSTYPQTQNVERYQQQIYNARDSRGQMSMTPNDQFSPSGHPQSFQWNAVDGHNLQQPMHNNFMAGYQAQPRIDHVPDHSPSVSRVQHADPRLHKGEHPEVSPDHRTVDPRLSHSDPRHPTQYSESRQPQIAGITRLVNVSDRDPRRRSIDEADTPRKIINDQEKKKRPPESWRPSFTLSRSENLKKNVSDRDKRRSSSTEQPLNKEDSNKIIPKKESNAISSPLDSLYGTTAIPRTGKGYGFQNFRIPKIKRPRPPTPPRPAPSRMINEDTGKDEDSDADDQQTKSVKSEPVNDGRKDREMGASDSKESDSQTKEVTQDLIEALIRKSFESGEGKKLFEHAKFFEKLSESLKNKKFRKIKRILESESEDSDSDNASKGENKDLKEPEKVVSSKPSKSKIRVIESDSDNEPLAEKLGIKVTDTSHDAKVVSDDDKPGDAASRSQDTPKGLAEKTSKDVRKDEDKIDTEVSKPVKKPATKRRNALELLQQDVRDMFIREGVVTATGYRMCRLLKEVQSGASLEEISKNEAKRMEDEADVESDSSSAVGKNEKKSKGRMATKNKNSGFSKANKKPTKTADPLSDSETSTGSKKKVKRNRQAIEDSDSDSSVSTGGYRMNKSKSNGSHAELDKEFVRRRRIPRVVLEKTDISKFRASFPKCHVDSEEESINEILNDLEKGSTFMLKRNVRKTIQIWKCGKLWKEDDDKYAEFFSKEPYAMKRKKLREARPFLTSKINDFIPKLHKSEIPKVLLTDLFTGKLSSSDVSLKPDIVSDRKPKAHFESAISTAADDADDEDDEKKDSASLLDRLHQSAPIKDDKSITDENEDVIEDNTSLTPESKTDHDSVSEINTGVPKSGELESVDERDCTCKNVTVSRASIKLNLVKKKGTGPRKKKCSKWQLGIIKKKSSYKSKSEQESGDIKEVEPQNETVIIDINNVKKDKEGSVTAITERDVQCKSDGTIEGDVNISVETNQPKEENDLGLQNKELSGELPNFTDRDYAFNSDAKQTACLLCSYEGKTIVQHYKQVHPESEVLISRLPIDEACRATTESEDKGYNESTFSEVALVRRKGPGSFHCRFCNYVAQYAVSFYEHTSSHTGEYRYQCCKCPYMSASRTTFKGHFYNHHPKNKLKQGLNLKVLTEGPSNRVKFIFGYLCSKCNFVQLLHENIEKHISLRHAGDKYVKALRINMSKSVSVESEVVSDDVESFVDNSEVISDDERMTDVEGEKVNKESVISEDGKEMPEIIEVKSVADTEMHEVKDGCDKTKKNTILTSQHEKKPNRLEAFVPVSLEVDSNECVILEERVKRTKDVIEKVNLETVLTNLQDNSGEDKDIVILLETKLQRIKGEIDMEIESSECEIISNNLDGLIDNSNVNNLLSVKNETNINIESVSEKAGGVENEENLKVPSDNDKINSNNGTEGNVAAVDDIEESNKPCVPIYKVINKEEGNERRITRSLSRTDDDGKSILSDDSGCETSNFEVIEITDESDIGEEELDIETVMSSAKSLQSDADEGVSLNLIERLTKHIVSKDCILQPENKELSSALKAPPLAVSLDKRSTDEQKAVVKKSAVVKVASLEARLRSDQSVLFSCLVPCCVFSSTDVSLMEKHQRLSHKPNWWDGVCDMCHKRVFGDDSLKGSPIEHKYPLSFALDHLRTVHVENLSLCDEVLEEESVPLSVAKCSPMTVDTNSLRLNSSNESQVATQDSTSQGNSEVCSLPEVSETDPNETKAPRIYIRTRRLSGDKLSAPASFQSQDVGTVDTSAPVNSQSQDLGTVDTSAPASSQSSDLSSMKTSCETLAIAVPETESNFDSNILSNEGGGGGDDYDDDELPWKIESVVSLNPSVNTNVNEAFMDQNVSDSTIGNPVHDSSNTPSCSSVVETSSKTSSSALPQPVVTYSRKLLAVPTSPVKKQLQIVSVAPAPVGTIAVVPSSLPSTNIPQPLVNLAQLIRPGTRVVVSKESSSVTASPVQYASPRSKNTVLLSGSNTLPKILPKPPSTYINIIASPVKSAASGTVVNLVASTSLSSPTQSSDPTGCASLTLVPRVRQIAGCQVVAQKSGKSSAVFLSDGSARTSLFLYKRMEQQRPPLKNTRQKLSHKLCKSFETAKASKLPSVYARMLIHDRLRQLFKCMAKHCNFSTDCVQSFEEHCWKHINLYHKLKKLNTIHTGENSQNDSSESRAESEQEEIKKIEVGGWPQCAYCCTLHATPKALSAHVQEEHGHCLYQCAYCFFRAFAYSYVVLHQNTNHTNMRITVLLCRKIPKLLPPVSITPPRKEVVLPYVCNQGNCGKTYYNPAAFWRHLENKHANMTYYYCHLCVGQYVKAEKLLVHYKLHCHCYYQCQYCLHGSDTKEDMQHHLCNFHPNQKPAVIMRDSDPNMPATGSEEETSIDHLRVIDMDENHHIDSIIFPPVPTTEFRERGIDFWKFYKAFADENPSVDTTDESLLVATPMEAAAIICLLPSTSGQDVVVASDTVTEMVTDNVDKSSEVNDSPKTDIPDLNMSSETIDAVNALLESSEKSINVVNSSNDTPVSYNTAVSQCMDTGKPQEESSVVSDKSYLTETKNDDCEVIIIDDSTDTEEQSESLGSVETERIPSPSEPDQAANDDSDSDIMIIGSDEEFIPSKRQKFELNMPLKETDPNYEPVVTLRHRDLESKARIESAIDPLAPDPQEKTDDVHVVENDEDDILEISASDKPEKLLFPESNILLPDTCEMRTEKQNKCPKNIISNSEETQGKLASLPDENDKPPQEQLSLEPLQEQELNSLDRSKAESASKNYIDSDIFAISNISAEDLEKTGASGERLFRCGNITCSYGAPTSNLLREHLLICDLSRESAGLTCVHCQRPFKQITPYMEHLKHHGTSRYNCFMCKFRAPLPQQVIKHMKQKHRIYNSIILPLNQQNCDPECDLFVVCSKDKTRPKIVPHFRKKRIFNPDEVNFLPVKYISYHPLTCNVCNYRSKVVSNMRRHLNFHNNKTLDPDNIPLSDPVNPVPHLEKKEMMFDKMTNLAASSHPLGRMGGKPPQSSSSGGPLEQITLPKFVPEHERYVCGSPGCNYLTCDETMLRYHLRALHGDETSYRCPHCPEAMQKDLNGLAISVDRMGAHLKMHDNKLYKCTHCFYFHFQRHIVERHLADRHPEKRPFVQVVREEGEVSNTSKPESSGSVGEGDLQPNAPLWMCGLCKAQYSTRTEVFEHAAAAHNIKSHYKCAVCNFRSSSKPNCEAHFYSRHSGVELDIIPICQRVGGDSIDSSCNSNTAVTAASAEVPAKRFDTTPLWLRNMVRIRHIRGVLLEDEEETRMHLQKVDETLGIKKPKVKEYSTPSSSRATTPEPEEPDSLEQKFGPYGKPAAGNLFLCTLCNKYKTKFKQDMREHLYRELNYAKWMCQHCCLTSSNRQQVIKHSKIHEKENKTESIVALQPDNETESWVDRLLTKQHNSMKGIQDIPVKQVIGIINKNKTSPSSFSSPTYGTSVPSVKSTNSTPNSKLGSPLGIMDSKETTDVSDDDVSLTSLRHSTQKRKLVSMVKRDLEDFEESRPKKNNLSYERLEDANIVDSDIKNVSDGTSALKEKNTKEDQVSRATPTLPAPSPDTYKCKDCKAIFAVPRALKLHVRLVHLRLGSFACGYCDHPTYSLMGMKQHCKARHPDLPELINHNKGASNIKLGDEFWEKEYGIKPRSEESTTSKKHQKACDQSPVQNTANASLKPGSSVLSQSISSSGSQVVPLRSSRFTNPPSISASASSLLKAATEASSAESVSASTTATSHEIADPIKGQVEAPEDTDDIILIDESRKCAYCEYRCKSSTDLRNHEMRHWVEKPLKCGHCDFEAVREYEIKKHSAKIHPNKKLCIVQKQLRGAPEIKPLLRVRKSTSRPDSPSNRSSISGNDETNSVSSEPLDASLETAVTAPEEVSTENRKIFRCFYCPLRAISLGVVHNHWEKTHKGRIMSATGVSRNGLPFRYKEVNVNDLLKGRDMTRKRKYTLYSCSYCNKKGSFSVVSLHHKQTHPDKPPKMVSIVTQYECAECRLVALSSCTLKRHFELQHPDQEFRYMVLTTKLPVEFSDKDLEQSADDGESSSRGSDSLLPNGEQASSTQSDAKLTSSRDKSVKYICSWCSETCTTEAKINFHHTMYHSHLELKFSVESAHEPLERSNLKTKVIQFLCPKCTFKVSSFEEMSDHLRKHCRPFKCGYCGSLFELPIHVRNHLSAKHWNQPQKIISLKEDLSALKAKVISIEEEVDSSQCPEIKLAERELPSEEVEVPRKKQLLYGFARKSTSMKPRILPVARKSTNPSTYGYSQRMEDTLALSESSSSRSISPPLIEEFSYYGQKADPLDWKKIRTTVNYGGVHVQVNVANMSQIFNLNPIVLVKDLKTQWSV